VSGGLERARMHLAAAAAAAETACHAWGVWADEVRERAERRMGAGPCDPRVCLDPEYAAALDAGRPFVEAARVTAMLAAGCRAGAAAHIAGDLPGPGFTGLGTAIGSPHS
jgi:hypothetical protein